MTKRYVWAAALILCSGIVSYAQNTNLSLDTGVKPHAGVDLIYRDFSDAYRTLNFEKLAGLYAETAAYLAPDQEVMIGRDDVRKSFRGFFESMKTEGRTMSIAFRILQRKTGSDLGYDVGIFTLKMFKDGRETSSGQGKFVVVTIKDKDGRWRFQVDGYSDLKPARPTAK